MAARHRQFPVQHLHRIPIHSLLPRRLGLRIRDSRNQLVHNLGARLLANVIDLLDLDVGRLLRILLGLLVARAVLRACQLSPSPI